jgi:hypothetical protein
MRQTTGSRRSGAGRRSGARHRRVARPRQETRGIFATRSRAFRGLFLVFSLSLVSLAGVWITVLGIGGLGEWNRWQFIGLFGVVEASAGIGNIISPNVWRLPVAEVQTPSKTKIHLAATTIFIPHWGGAARAAAGLLMMGVAAWNEGLGIASLGLLPLIAALAFAVLAVSVVIARFGVDRPDIDVVQLIVRRAGKDFEVPPISIGASFFQMILSIITIPAVKALPRDVLYQPEFAPSPGALAVTIGVALLSGAAMLLAWRGRIDWHAPAEQQREAERFA